MGIQYATYNDNFTEAGKFYLVEVNKDNVSNVRLTTSITEPIANNTLRITALENEDNEFETQIDDNTARINNLEDRTLDEELFYALDLASIKTTFANETRVEIQHNRKEIYLKKVMAYNGTIGDKEIYTDITNGVKITEEIQKNSEGDIIAKRVVIESNNPMTGYAVIL